MKRPLFLLLAAALCGGSALSARGADQANTPEARLRDALRNTMLQLRSVTTERDNLQAQNADLDSQKTQLAAQVATLAKQSAADKDASTKTIGELKARLSDQEGTIAQLQKALQQWQDSQKKAVALGMATEAKRARLAEENIRLQRTVDEQRTKNLAMFQTGMEVLDRYQKFGLGEALTAKEPFVGLTRTKFQTLVQDYSDKLEDQRIKP